MARPACGRGGCTFARMPGKQRCVWHWLLAQPADVQQAYAADRREQQLGHDLAVYQARVDKSKWPEGQRWCAGCQSFVPLFYTSGSRCKACASAASHSQRIEREYGITGDEYDELFELQGGRCYICQRRPRTLRLAVDHDHKTGQVRGLLCSNNENGCNRGVVANLEAAADGGLAAARRAVEYLEHPPYARLKGLPRPSESPAESLNPVPAPRRELPPF